MSQFFVQRLRDTSLFRSYPTAALPLLLVGPFSKNIAEARAVL